MVKVLIGLVRFYQRFISPFKRPCCRFYPTCSEYAIEAVKEYGSRFGAFLALKRFLKCHPFHPGGYDPVIADDRRSRRRCRMRFAGIRESMNIKQ